MNIIQEYIAFKIKAHEPFKATTHFVFNSWVENNLTRGASETPPLSLTTDRVSLAGSAQQTEAEVGVKDQEHIAACKYSQALE